ncbi:MAG: hypothetical protein OXD54_03640 [Candidatus Poribacteria bacterium]|nr:hypothetical protein [Candidatus Poribacteria bacterium]
MSPYRKVLSSAQNKLNEAFEPIRNIIPHSGEIGTLVEQQFHEQLVEILPEKIGVSHGFVMDSYGEMSKQMDIILYDKMNTPRIFTGDGAQIFPVEATYACGEIKTYLDTERFMDSFEKCLSYKNLRRKAYFEHNSLVNTTYNLFGTQQEHWQSIFFCLAVESVNATVLQKYYNSIAPDLSIDKRIDTVMVLSSTDGVNCLLNVLGDIKDGIPPDKSINLLPQPGSRICTYRAKQPWALFVMLLLRYMSLTPTEPVDMLYYGGGTPY